MGAEGVSFGSDMSSNSDGVSRRAVLAGVSTTGLLGVGAFAAVRDGGDSGTGGSPTTTGSNTTDAGGSTTDDGDPGSPSSDLPFVELPEGFRIEVFAEELSGAMVEPHGGANPGPRFMAFRDETLFVAVPGEPYSEGTDEGHVLAFPNDGDDPVDVAQGLNRPNSLAFHDGWMYVANALSVDRYRLDGLSVESESRETLVEFERIDGPATWSTTIEIHGGSLWITKGTAIGAGRQTEFREAVTRCSLDGTSRETYAEGLRNAVGMAFRDDTLVVSEMGMGHEDPDYPPDEINVIEKGNHYGWPYCHADNDPIDPEFAERADAAEHADLLRESDENCADKTPPAVELTPHMSPLGLTFYDGDAFPEEYRGDLFVASHGSWDIEPARGYKLARIDWDGDREVRDFATGWLGSDGDIRGRPVDVVVGPDGDMYVSDDTEGRIYRLWYEG